LGTNSLIQAAKRRARGYRSKTKMITIIYSLPASSRYPRSTRSSEIGGESGDPFHRCALAHAMADVQDDVHEELLWDLRRLAAADLLTDERAARGGVAGPVAGFCPRCTQPR